MKLRIKGNSLRLRITPSEMTRLSQTGRIEETIYFGREDGAKLTYALEHSTQVSGMGVRYRPSEVVVAISSDEMQRWSNTGEVGLYGKTESSHGPLELAVEKDFACLDKSDADNADRFANPNHGSVC